MARSVLEICREIDAFFGTDPSVRRAVERLAHNLRELDVSFAITGDLALMGHGYWETTARPAILLRLDDLQRFQTTYVGQGYEERSGSLPILRDMDFGVDFAVHLVGQYPGVQGPHAVGLLTPENTTMGADGIPYISLAPLLITKLAICAASPHAYKHMADVIGLIHANQLPPDYAEALDSGVAAQYDRFWKLAQIDDPY